MMRSQSNGGGVMTVPDREMENFIRVTSSIDDNCVFFLDNGDYLNKLGKRVRITAGRFKDVIGVVKRIKKNRHVVVQIEGIAAVAITFVPSEFLEYLTDV
jgi:transcription antitermination factor NusG